MEFIKKSMEGGRVNHDFSCWLMTLGVLDDTSEHLRSAPQLSSESMILVFSDIK